VKFGLANGSLVVADDGKTSHVCESVEESMVQVVDVSLKPWCCVDHPTKSID